MEYSICTFNDLRKKEVINISNGVRLGNVCDAELDLKSGKIISLIVPEKMPLFSFKKPVEYRIPWDRITKIGEDIILICDAIQIGE